LLKTTAKSTKFIAAIAVTIIIAACAKEKIEMKERTTPYIEITRTEPTYIEKETGSTASTPPVAPGTNSLFHASTDVPAPVSPDAAASSAPQTPVSDAQTVVMSAAGDNDITSTAKTLLGIPFAAGGDNPNDGFDNSGFIYYVLKQNGYAGCPRGVGGQAAMGTSITKLSDLLPGDLVFFSDDGITPQYGGIYIGNGTMIYAPQPGQNVKEVNISSGYYYSHFVKGVRVI
jgi:cell wall-associated NlpC family hydrolase